MRKNLMPAVLFLSASIAAHATTIISTLSFWDGSNVAFNFANDGQGQPIFGQTVTVPVNGDNSLTSFTFKLFDDSTITIPFQACVIAWNPVTKAPMGSNLFCASSTTKIVPVNSYQYDDYTFSPNLSLAAGGVYLLYFDAQTSPTPTHVQFAAIQNTAGDVYKGGAYIYGPGTTWYTSTGSDIVFTAVFNSTAGQVLPKISSAASAGAFGAFAAAAPGSWIEIYGSNLAGNTRSWTTADFTGNAAPTTLDHTSVTIGGQSAFVDYISPTQVNAQVPSNVGTGAQPLIVTTSVGASAAVNVTMNVEQPGLLAPPSFAVGGTQYVVALFPDGATYVLPPGAIVGANSRRAKTGDVITLYGIGFGTVSPSIQAGQIEQAANALANSVHILFGGVEGVLSYQGLAPSAVGLYQFNVTVPNVTPGDAVPVTFTLAGTAGAQKLAIAIQ
jgi:uncharacterized protein (TIGR03437 family)